jgi:hypothetical protein
VDFGGLFHTIATTINTYMNIVSRELLGFQLFPINVESCKCVLSWWKKEHKFLIIILLAQHIIGIPLSQIKIEWNFSIVGIFDNTL